MVPGQKISQIEKNKRIRIIMEWLLEDWIAGDIIAQCVAKWNITDRQAFRYLSEARKNWNKDENTAIDQKRRQKIESLKKLKRSLKESHKGTPGGIRAVLAVEREIITLENLRPATKIQLSGDKENPIQHETKQTMDLSKLTEDELEKIIALSKKATVE